MNTGSARFRRVPTGKLIAFAAVGMCFFGGWLGWCATIQFAGVQAQAEIVETYEKRHRRKRGRSYAETYGVVRCIDQEGRAHTDEVRLNGGEVRGHKIPVRYLPSRPEDIRRDEFWDIWGLAVLSGGVFALIVFLIWLAEGFRRQGAPNDPFGQRPS